MSDSYELTQAEVSNPLFWQEGNVGCCNIVSFDGEDVRGIAYVQHTATKVKLIRSHNQAIRTLLKSKGSENGSGTEGQSKNHPA